MLLRIAPTMFTDARFACVTISPVVEEIVRSKKLKDRYPWRNEFRQHLRPQLRGQVETADYRIVRSTVAKLAANLRNPRNHDRPFHLSPEDVDVVAAAITHGWQVTTVDGELVAFLSLQYGLGALEPLHLVNEWLQDGLIVWDDGKHVVVEDWMRQNEKPQSAPEIRRFEKLTGRTYPSWTPSPGTRTPNPETSPHAQP
jgi:hypothetical protein